MTIDEDVQPLLEINNPVIMVTIQHPLLDAVCEFDADAARRYPADCDQGLGQMGLLIHSRLANAGYWCTPTNSAAFASTGGDGVHFSFLVDRDTITENSPVVVTVPAKFGEPEFANVVVAENLGNFLRFGLHRGYFGIEQLAYEPDLTLQAYGSADWQPSEDRHYSVGYHLSENGQRVRDFLIKRFDLEPLSYTVGEFDELQNTYKPLLKYPVRDSS